MPRPHARSGSSCAGDTFIPARRWQLTNACGICGRGFHYLRGRHHCRHCGASVCGKHSRNKAVVPSSLSTKHQRVCDECFPECQRGVTRRRRKTVGARAISLRFVDDESSDIATETATARSKSTDYESTTTTVATSTTTTYTSSTNPASVVYSSPLRLPKHETAPIQAPERARSPREQLTSAQTAAVTPNQPMTRDEYRAQQRQLHARQLQDLQRHEELQRQQQQQERQQQQQRRRRASTSASKPKALRQYVDSMVSSSSSNCSFSSLEDHSSSSDDDSDDEELIAKYLRRGAPLRSLGSTTGSATATSVAGMHRKDSSPPVLEAIAEKQSFEAPATSNDGGSAIVKALQLQQQSLRCGARNRIVSSASSCGTVSVTESEECGGADEPAEEEEQGGDSSSAVEWDAHGRRSDSSSSSSSSCDESEVAVVTYSVAPQTPPSRLNLKTVALAYSTAVKAAVSVWSVTPVAPPTPPPRTATPSRTPQTPPRTPPRTRKPVTATVLKPTTSKQSHPSAAAPGAPQPAPSPPQASQAEYQLTEQDQRVMREIVALELEIQKHQSELPALLEALQQSERTAAQLRDEVQESRLRVQQYRQAQCVVNRSMRNARALMREKEFQAAILELLRASGIDRSSAAVWHLLAECRLHVSQLEEAEHACRKSMRLQQQQGRSVCASAALLGRILQQQGRSDDAVECYLIALARR